MSDTIICPNCQSPIEVTEVLSAQLRGEMRREFEAEQRKKEAQFAEREAAIHRQTAQLKESQASIDKQVSDKLDQERRRLIEDAIKKAKEDVAVDLKDAQQQLSETHAKLKASQDAELALRKERR